MVALSRRSAAGRTALVAVTVGVAVLCAGCEALTPGGGSTAASGATTTSVTTALGDRAADRRPAAPGFTTGFTTGSTTGTNGRGDGPATTPTPEPPSRPSSEASSGALTRSGPEPERGPVVIVPGYGGQTALLQPLIDALRADGRTVHLVTGLGDATFRLQRQARTTQRQIDRLLAAGAPSVDVIGFSQGGLVTRLWARDGGQAHVRRAVTLGAPHHGSRMAALAERLAPRECPSACRQLVPGSAFLSGLGDSAPGPGWTSIWTRSDRISTPARTAVLDGAVSFAVQEVCPDVPVAHGMLPRTPFVVDLVVQTLDAPEPLVSAPRQVASGCPPPP